MEAPLHPPKLELDSVPDDVALAIASFLSARDLCSLGSCSRFWNRLCASDFLWSSLSSCRWPSMESPSPPSSSPPPPSSSRIIPPQEEKSDYIRRHREMASRFSAVAIFVDQCSQNESLEVADFLKAVTDLHGMKAGFLDVKLFFLTPKRGVLLNLIGLHYLIFSLRVPAAQVLEALRSSGVRERRVRVNWFKLGRWFYGFRLPDESRSRKITLLELVTSEEEVRAVLNRGVLHEVLRVQITALPP